MFEPKCIICGEEPETKEEGICLDCQQQIFKALDMKVEFLDDEPFVKVTPKTKQPLYDLIENLSRLASNVAYNFYAMEHHSHSRKEVEVVDIE